MDIFVVYVNSGGLKQNQTIGTLFISNDLFSKRGANSSVFSSTKSVKTTCNAFFVIGLFMHFEKF